MLSKDSRKKFPIANVSKNGRMFSSETIEFSIEFKNRCFVDIEQQESRNWQMTKLPAKRTADRAASSGDEHNAITICINPFSIPGYRAGELRILKR